MTCTASRWPDPVSENIPFADGRLELGLGRVVSLGTQEARIR